MDVNLIPVILSGGVGSRLWPVSREAHPKPFMVMPDGWSLIQKTFLRAAKLQSVEEILTVTNRELLFQTEDEFRALDSEGHSQTYILEPFGRGTAAAVALAALQLQRKFGDDAQMLILPADSLIEDDAAFSKAVSQALRLSSEGWLVTFGVKPESPETGFGYLKVNVNDALGVGFKVTDYVEKPALEAAQSYVASAEYFWSSGMFCFRVGTILAELQHCAPSVLAEVRACFAKSRLATGAGYNCLTIDGDSFANVPDMSIDCAVMERTRNVAMVACDIGWADIGSWSAMSRLTAENSEGNRCVGQVLTYGARGNYVRGYSRLIALVGVEDLLVIDTADAVLVAHKDAAQDVKKIVGQLKDIGHDVHKQHRTVHCPWGTYVTLEEGQRFKIKRIMVKPGAAISLQMHHHRSEHWIVVSGMAIVVNDQTELKLNANESTCIRAGHKHQIKNPGVIDLVLIEVQSGDYLGEDDIFHLEDIYGRVA